MLDQNAELQLVRVYWIGRRTRALCMVGPNEGGTGDVICLEGTVADAYRPASTAQIWVEVDVVFPDGIVRCRLFRVSMLDEVEDTAQAELR